MSKKTKYDKQLPWSSIRQFKLIQGSGFREINPKYREIFTDVLNLDDFLVSLIGDAYSYEMLRKYFGISKEGWHPANNFEYEDVQSAIKDLKIKPINRRLLLTVRYQAPKVFRNKRFFT